MHRITLPAHTFVSLLVVLLLSLAQPQAATPDTDEPRKAYAAQSPDWLKAVGRLQVPVQRQRDGQTRYFLEDCSATLVGRDGQATSDIIVTAWHCLDGYSDLSRDILFTPISTSSEHSTVAARLLSSGGSMQADWAILRLRRSLPAADGRALRLLPADADRSTHLAMAGYSRDSGLGQGGAQLTYDPTCRVTSDSANAVDTNCRAYKGASGGAVAQRTAAGMAYRGVVSAGDSATLSRFVPLAIFRSELLRQLD